MENGNGSRGIAAKVVPDMTEVLRAWRSLQGKVHTTPFEHSPFLSDRSGAEVFVKWENLQRCRSFKIRGALNRMMNLTASERAAGVVTASSGNHAQGVATAARMLGVQALIYVPETCPEVKQEAIRRIGGDFVTLRRFGRLYDDTEAEALRVCREEERIFVSAYEDRYVVAGQGTVGVEMFLAEPDLEDIVCPLSGGGLLGGITVAAGALAPKARLWGAHAAANPSWAEAFRAGKVVPVEELDSLADALGGAASKHLFPFLRERLAGLDAVSEREIGEAIAFVHRTHHQVIEGGAATSVAALLSGRLPLEGRKVGVVVSGGNIDEGRLLRLLCPGA
ncbi:threonine ammonia-lyase [Aminiphilus circumscriptus]|jgi:threonine dehydratase|uniref:threonine ammonia-lyase n=1 Tax=Aminiphilus circumscriptus TaxID=290732 RepID=UPI0004AD0ED0|nr:threonine/serine dehydratase [Aminiphilus circumscriptus]